MNSLYRCSLYRSLRICFCAIAFAALVAFGHAQATSVSSPTASSLTKETRWVDNTSGPFYTGTADVEPGGSYYLEPYLFDFRTKGQSNDYAPMKFAYGLGHWLEFDAYAPTDYNHVSASQSPNGKSHSSLGYGDTLFQLKWQLTKEKNRYDFWTLPSLCLSFDLNVPTGKDHSANPNLSAASQTSNGTWNEQVNFLFRKQFKPFQLYLQETELIQNPTNVIGPYQFNNGIASLPAGQRLRMIDGNAIESSAAIEHVLIPRAGFGYLVEYNTERQMGRSLLFGKANAPTFSYFDLSPELEVTWPAKGKYPVTWGAGTTFTAARSHYPAQLTPMVTVSFYGDLHGQR